MFCALSKNNQHLLGKKQNKTKQNKKTNASYSYLFEELKNGFAISIFQIGQTLFFFLVLVQNSQMLFGLITQEYNIWCSS